MIGKIIFALCLIGFFYLFFFNKPRHHTNEELQSWFSTRIEKITNELDKDVELDKLGQYPHAGKQSFASKGAITYHLLDKQYARFELSEHHPFSIDDIKSTRAWKKLSSKADSLGYELSLDEIEIDGDEIDSYESLDEYIDDIPRYFTITVSGW